MDYEELIRDLETWNERSGPGLGQLLKRAITAIQTVIVERDQARQRADELSNQGVTE